MCGKSLPERARQKVIPREGTLHRDRRGELSNQRERAGEPRLWTAIGEDAEDPMDGGLRKRRVVSDE